MFDRSCKYCKTQMDLFFNDIEKFFYWCPECGTLLIVDNDFDNWQKPEKHNNKMENNNGKQ